MSSPSTATAPSRTPCAATTAAEIGDGHVPYGLADALAEGTATSAANEAEREVLRLPLAERDALSPRRESIEQFGILQITRDLSALQAIDSHNPVVAGNHTGEPERAVLR